MFVDFVEKELAKHTATLEQGKIEMRKLEEAGKTDCSEYKLLQQVLSPLEMYINSGKDQLELLKKVIDTSP